MPTTSISSLISINDFAARLLTYIPLADELAQTCDFEKLLPSVISLRSVLLKRALQREHISVEVLNAEAGLRLSRADVILRTHSSPLER